MCLRPSEIGEAGSLMGFSTDQEQHDQMLRGWVEALRGRGYTQISAALPETPNKPRQTAGGYRFPISPRWIRGVLGSWAK